MRRFLLLTSPGMMDEHSATITTQIFSLSPLKEKKSHARLDSAFFYSCHSKTDVESLSFCFVEISGRDLQWWDGLWWFTSFSLIDVVFWETLSERSVPFSMQSIRFALLSNTTSPKQCFLSRALNQIKSNWKCRQSCFWIEVCCFC